MADENFNGRYILDKDGNVMPCVDLIEWAQWFETSIDQRRVARDQVGDYTVSTIFLGLDHGFGLVRAWETDPLHYQPVLWESIVFSIVGGACDMWRYRSREAALEGHAALMQEYQRIADQEAAWLNDRRSRGRGPAR